MVEVKSADTNPSKLPEVEPIQTGKIDTTITRCFDLFCVGKYEQGNDLKLDIRSADKIPNLVTKDADGNPIFCKPKPMCTIRGLEGHNIWVNIELKTITTNATNYMCLGIKKQGEDDYYDILHTENLSRYVDVLESDVVELIPLISSTELPTYTPVKAGETTKIVEDTDTYDFGSVYRVHISLHKGQWLTGQKSNLKGSNCWFSVGQIGIGPIVDQTGQTRENQLVIINSSGTLAYSSDGQYWIENGSIGISNSSTPVRGHGIWCIAASKTIKRSIDNGKTWLSFQVDMNINSNLIFANGVFMVIPDDKNVYVSPDAGIWTQIGKVDCPDRISFVIFGDNKYICGSVSGYIYCSEDGKGTWIKISDELYQMEQIDGAIYDEWRGGCYVNGYFYTVRSNYYNTNTDLIVRSPNGVNWYRVQNLSDACYHNVTYYKNKLYIFDCYGKYNVGLFNPDGTIESLE